MMLMKLFQISFNRPFLLVFIAIISLFNLPGCQKKQEETYVISKVTPFAGISDDKAKHFGEPFGAAVDKNGVLYISDGEQGKIRRVIDNENTEFVTDKLNTPSPTAF